MGMAHDCLAAGHAPLPDRPAAISPTAYSQGPAPLRQQGPGGRRRREPVRGVGHFPGSDHRYGQHHRCGDGCGPGRTGCRVLVLAHRGVRHVDQICRGTAGRKIPGEKCVGRDDWRSDVRPGTRTGHEMAGYPVLYLHRTGGFRHRQHGAGQFHFLITP